MRKNENFYYLCYVLGYDLLHDDLINTYFNDCDTTFQVVEEIVKKFLKSEENANLNKSQYDCLVDFITNNKDYITKTLDKYSNTIPF